MCHCVIMAAAGYQRQFLAAIYSTTASTAAAAAAAAAQLLQLLSFTADVMIVVGMILCTVCVIDQTSVIVMTEQNVRYTGFVLLSYIFCQLLTKIIM